MKKFFFRRSFKKTKHVKPRGPSPKPFVLRRDKSLFTKPAIVKKYVPSVTPMVKALTIIKGVSRNAHAKMAKALRYNAVGGDYAPKMVDIPRMENRDRCQERQERRQVLFATRIAGPGLRKSPGKGGSYRPSEGPCERRF